MKKIEDQLSLAIGTSMVERGEVNHIFVKAFLMGHIIGKYKRDITSQEKEFINNIHKLYSTIKLNK